MLIRNNITLPNTFRQAFLSKSEKTSLLIESSLENFSLTGKLERKGLSKVMDHILWRYQNGHTMKICIETIARSSLMDLTPRHVHRLIKQLESLGYITLIKHHRQAHIYVPDPLFFDAPVRIALRHLLPQLHDEKLSRRAQEATIICNNKLYDRYKNQRTVSHIRNISNSVSHRVDNEKMSYHLKGNILYINPVSITERAHATYTEFSFDEIPDTVRYGKVSKEIGETLNGNEKDLFLIPDHTNSPVLKKDLVMKIYQLKSIKLTQWGQIRLNAFPESVVKTIDDQLLRMNTRPDRPWNYFISACKRYCEQNGIDINWNEMQRLAGQQCMPDQGPFIDESFIPLPVPNRSSKSTKDKSGVNWGKAQANEEYLVQFGKDRMAAQQAKAAIEYPSTPRAVALRQSLGMDEFGVFVNEQSELEAISKIIGEEHGNSSSDSDIDYSVDPFGDRNEPVTKRHDLTHPQSEEYTWPSRTNALIAWFITNLKNLPDDYEKTYMLIKQILTSKASPKNEAILFDVISNLKRILDEEANSD